MGENTDRANLKPPPVDRLSLLWRRVNDHKMVQWGLAYVALAYGLQHGVILTSESLDWPHAVARISMLLLALGLPVVMTFAWYHGMRASRRISGPELTIIAILLVVGSLFFYVFVQPSAELAAGTASALKVQSAAVAGVGATAGISVAVLPFANLSGDTAQEFFSDGMTEEITSALAKVPTLRMVGRTSAFQFKGQNKDLRAIGQSLGATYLIEGSVRKAGERVRVTAQLVKADDGIGLWTDNYDRDLKDIFVTQEDIAQAIAGALRVPLGLKRGATLIRNRTSDAESYDQYLRAKALVRLRGLKELTDAAALLEQVVARDPNYAPAWALLAEAYYLTPTYTPAVRSGSLDELRRIVDAFFLKAEAAARRAILLDANQADGYSALGNVQSARGKLLLADDLYKQALALDSNNPDALYAYSQMLGRVGRLKEALAMKQRVQALEPLVPVFKGNLGAVLWLNGENDAALAMVKDQPPEYRGGVAQIYAAMGRYGEAADTLQTIPAGTFPPGMVEAAARLLRTAPAKAASPQTLPRLWELGWVYLYIGAPNRVLEFHEGIVEVGYSGGLIVASLWHPSYAPVRKTERFKTLMRKAGLVDYWRARGWPEFCHPTTVDDFACD